MSFFVYLLYSPSASGQKTYVGATVNLEHRLRQHNGEIKGGAHATSGQQWERVCHVEGFPDWPAALQFEWRFKQLTRKLPARMDPLERRIQALQQLLSLERSTTKAIPFAEWPSPPVVVIESERLSHVTFPSAPVVDEA